MANLNTHMTHLEDAVFLLGIDKTRESLDFLRQYRDTLAGTSSSKVNTTVKWDGAPALFIGKHPVTGEFFVAKKSLFNKTPLYYTSVADIKKSADLSSELKKKFTYAFNAFKDSGIPNIIQGDFLFDEGDIKEQMIDGEMHVTFHPNTIVYSVPSKSELGKALKKKKFGIVFHTTYTGKDLSYMTNSFGAKIPKHSNDYWVIDAKYQDMSGTATMTKSEMNKINGYLSSAGKHFAAIGKDAFAVINQEQIALHATTYTNKFVRGGRTPTGREAAAGFIEFIKAKFQAEKDKRSTPKGKQNVNIKMLQILDPLRSLDHGKLEHIFGLYYDLMEAKNLIIKKLSQSGFVKTFLLTTDGWKVTGQEGFVAIDKKGTRAVKLVDRLDFSYANFSKDVIKGWESDSRN